eukprot:5869673-Ditylum_brightwellii.AAC.1
MIKKKSTVCKSHSKREGKHKDKCKADKNTYYKRGQVPPRCHTEGKGDQYYKYHGYCNYSTDSATSPSTGTKDVYANNVRKGPARAR